MAFVVPFYDIELQFRPQGPFALLTAPQVRAVERTMATAATAYIRSYGLVDLKARMPKDSGRTATFIRARRVRHNTVRIHVPLNKVPYAGFIEWRRGQGPFGATNLRNFFVLWYYRHQRFITQAVGQGVLQKLNDLADPENLRRILVDTVLAQVIDFFRFILRVGGFVLSKGIQATVQGIRHIPELVTTLGFRL